jgi:hypothetical protein
VQFFDFVVEFPILLAGVAISYVSTSTYTEKRDVTEKGSFADTYLKRNPGVESRVEGMQVLIRGFQDCMHCWKSRRLSRGTIFEAPDQSVVVDGALFFRQKEEEDDCSVGSYYHNYHTAHVSAPSCFIHMNTT